MDSLSALLTGENAAVVGAIVALTSTLRAVFPSLFASSKGQRLLPVFPVFLGVLVSILGFGDVGDVASWQDKVVFGCVAGFTAGQLFKAGKTSIFGWGLEDSSEET